MSASAPSNATAPRSVPPAAWAAGLLTAALVTFVQLKVERPLLLAERFVPGLGWVEIAALTAYATWLARALLLARGEDSGRIRGAVWLLFSVVFFGQLALGLAGVEECLMTGKLHLPVPAMIAAGPVYRGEGFFMTILFATTLLFIGPGWCSMICYIGAWDDRFARRQRRARELPPWRGRVRIVLLLVVVAGALVLRLAGAPVEVAAGFGLGFGLVGVAVMAILSRRSGAMVHCTAYCPIGFLATTLGRISPFRVRIDTGCTDCLRCRSFCRFDALRAEDIARRRPGPSCTLCGDCLTSCKWQQLHYSFPGLGPSKARALYVVLIVTFHAASLGFARI